MEIYVLSKAVQNWDSLDLYCLGVFPVASKAREAMRKDYDATRNETDFDREEPDSESDSAWIISDDGAITRWSVHHKTLDVGPKDAEAMEVPL